MRDRHSGALDLIRAAVPPGGTWADLGAGAGVFTAALAELVGESGRVLAVDSSPASIRALRELAASPRPGCAPIEPALADFLRIDDAAIVRATHLDGALFANSLHFTADAGAALSTTARRVRPGGRIVVVEYDDRPASRWVPYPLGFERLRQIAAACELPEPQKLAARPSAYGGIMYAALLEKAERRKAPRT